MKKVVKKYFVPHKGNRYKPHLLREMSAISILILIVVLFLIATFGPSLLLRTKFGAAIYSSVLVDITNTNRVAYNSTPLTVNPVLVKAAALKAEDMVKNSYFAHNSPAGITPWYWFGQAGYKFLYAGENLAIDFINSEDVAQAWMNSPTHRANVLNQKFTEIGIATAEGFYQGRATTFVVQMFGRPDPQAVASTEQVTRPAETPQVVVVPQVVPTPQDRTPTAAVKGESVAPKKTQPIKVVMQKEMFLAVEKATEQDATVSPTSTAEVSMAGGEVIQKHAWLKKFVLNPSGFLQAAYGIIAAVLILSLLCAVFIERKNQHIKHVLYGFLLLAIMIILVYLARSPIYETAVLIV